MKKEDLLIGVHSSRPNDSDAAALISAIKNNGVRACFYSECVEKNILPNLTIGFDSAGLPHWQKIMNKGIVNIMWSKDSVFTSNIDIVEQFSSFDKFVLLTSTPCDTEPIGKFFPKIKHGYLPMGVNSENVFPVEKEFEIIHYGHIVDIEAKMDELKAKMPEFVFKLMSDIYTISVENPWLSFWQVYTLFVENLKLEIDFEQYLLLFSNIAPVISSHKQIQMMDKLKDFNIKVFGNSVWTKYISGKTEYAGVASDDIVSKAKIVIYSHPVELSLGLPEVVLKSAMANSFVVSSNTKSIELEFKDSMAYYDFKTFDDIASKVDYFLHNVQQRESKAADAYKIAHERNSINHRVAQIINLILASAK